MTIPGMEAIGNDTGLFTTLALWTTLWEGLALWKASARGEKGWFIALLFLNIAGILPIMYLFFFSDEKRTEANDDKKGTLEVKE